jgi:hypothetical protein
MNPVLQIVNIVVISITGFFIAWYTIETYKLRIDSAKPVISIIYNLSFSNVSLQNIGKGPALNLKLEIEGPQGGLEDITDLLSSKNLGADDSIDMSQNIKQISMYHRACVNLSKLSVEERTLLGHRSKSTFLIASAYNDIYGNHYATTAEFQYKENFFVIKSTTISKR